MTLIQSLKKWRRTDRGWPRYLPGGRVRTSTAGLLIAFVALSWLNQTYEPPAPAPAVPETAVVPPGFVPDPEYTWVPRTNVQERPRTTTPRTTTTTTEPSPTDTPSPTPTTPTTPVEPTDEVPTTVVDPDGPGPLPPSTVTPTTTPALPTVPPLPMPFGPAPAPTPTTPDVPR
jgi:cytoskeletal protein RodZ